MTGIIPSDIVAQSLLFCSKGNDAEMKDRPPMPKKKGYVYYWNRFGNEWVEVPEEQDKVNKRHDEEEKEKRKLLLKGSRLANRDRSLVKNVKAINVEPAFDTITIDSGKPPPTVDMNTTIFSNLQQNDLNDVLRLTTMDFDENPDANSNPVGYIVNAQLAAKVHAAVTAQEINKNFTEFQEFVRKNERKKKSRRSQKHRKAFIKDKVDLGSEDEDAQFDANTVRYLKSRVREDRKKIKNTQDSKRSNIIHKRRAKSFANYVAKLANYAEEHPNDHGAAAKAKDAEEMLKLQVKQPKHKAGGSKFKASVKFV